MDVKGPARRAVLIGLPTMLRCGANDRTVSPWLSRRFARLLRSLGGEVDFVELAGKEHWWWDTKRTNDGGALFDQQLWTFYGKAIRGEAAGERRTMRDFTVTSFNPALFGSRGGVRILQPRGAQSGSVAQIDVHVGGDAPPAEARVAPDGGTLPDGNGSHWRVRTTNVRRFALGRHRRAAATTPASLTVDGQEINARAAFSSNSTIVLDDNQRWRVTRDRGSFERGGVERGAAFLG